MHDDECSTPEGDTDWFTSTGCAVPSLSRWMCSTPEGDTDWFTPPVRPTWPSPPCAQRPKATLIGSLLAEFIPAQQQISAQRPKATLIGSLES